MRERENEAQRGENIGCRERKMGRESRKYVLEREENGWERRKYWLEREKEGGERQKYERGRERRATEAKILLM